VVGAELPGGGEEREHGERGEEGLEVEAEERGGRRTSRNGAAGRRFGPHCPPRMGSRRAEQSGEWECRGLGRVWRITRGSGTYGFFIGGLIN
jgi:hypothetical protein